MSFTAGPLTTSYASKMWSGSTRRGTRQVTVLHNGVVHNGVVTILRANRMANDLGQGLAPELGRGAKRIPVADIEWLSAAENTPCVLTIGYRRANRLTKKNVVVDADARSECASAISSLMGPTTISTEQVGAVRQFRTTATIAALTAGLYLIPTYGGLSRTTQKGLKAELEKLLHWLGPDKVLLIGGIITLVAFLYALTSQPTKIVVRRSGQTVAAVPAPHQEPLQPVQGQYPAPATQTPAAPVAPAPPSTLARPLVEVTIWERIYSFVGSFLLIVGLATLVSIGLQELANEDAAASGFAAVALVGSVACWRWWWSHIRPYAHWALLAIVLTFFLIPPEVLEATMQGAAQGGL